jgi:response regulator RpfG family c-di-GMP phosphodiesterase
LGLLDIARMVLPEKLFVSASLLTRDELDSLKNHPTTGADYLKKLIQDIDSHSSLIHPICQIVKTHHERYDGTGTPQAMKGEEIHPLSRIAYFVDTYESMRRNRKTRVGASHEAAAAKILSELTEQFDPWVLIAFQECETRIASIYENYPDPLIS